MNKIIIKAKGSSDEPYTVEFLLDGNRLSVFCNCKAGQFGQICKHKTELIAGDQSRLFDESDSGKLTEVSSLISRAASVKDLASQIADSEQIIRREQAKVKKIKKIFGDQLKSGIEISEA